MEIYPRLHLTYASARFAGIGRVATAAPTKRSWLRLLRCSRGAAAVEYAVLLTAVLAVASASYLLSHRIIDAVNLISHRLAGESQSPTVMAATQEPVDAGNPDAAKTDAAEEEPPVIDPDPADKYPLAAAIVCGTAVVVGWLVMHRCKRHRAPTAVQPPEPLDGEAIPPALRLRLYNKRQALMRCLGRDHRVLLQNQIEVRHLMTTELVTVAPTATRDNMLALMERHCVRHLPVQTAGGELLGLVSDRDLRGSSGGAAAQYMTRSPRTVTPDTALSPAITYLINEGVSCLPVVANGRLCGIVTTTDLILALQCTLQLWLRVAQLLDADGQLASMVDPHDASLSGMGSREELGGILELLLAVGKRYGQPLSLVVVAVEGLAEAHEGRGQAEGDELLKAVGSLVLEAVRESDFVARANDDAFVVVLPQTILSGAEVFCQRLHAAAQSAAPPDLGSRIRTGVAAAVAGDDAAALLQRAEAAAYGARHDLAIACSTAAGAGPS